MMNFKPILWILILLGSIVTFHAHSADKTNSPEVIASLIQTGEQQRQQGHLRQANTAFTEALTLAKQLSDPKAEALSSGLLGYTLFQQQQYAAAEPLLKQAWQASLDNHWPDLATLHANYLGNYYLHQRRLKQAEYFHHESLKWAQKSGDKTSAIQARLNLARLAQRQSKPEQAWDRLQNISATLPSIITPNDRARLSLQTGYQALTLKPTAVIRASRRIQIAYQTLTDAQSLANQNGDTRTQSLALGYLGQLYESQQRKEC